MSDFFNDLRYAFRGLRKSPGFTFVAVATLALGIGVNTAMFGLLDRALLKPLPFVRPGELVQVIETWNDDKGYGPPSWLDFVDWRNETRSFEGLAGYLTGAGTLLRRGEPDRVRLVQATANLFDLLGVRPALGRGFLPREDSPGAPCRAVLSDPLWRSRFGGDPRVVETSIVLNGAPCSVVGIAPPRFEFPIGLGDGLWTTLRPEGTLYPDRGSHFLATVARLKPGVSAAAASSEIDGVMRRISRTFPDAGRNRGARVVPLRDWTSANYREKLYILSAAVAVVLLIACVNLASMLLAKSTTRRRELAIRMALGASRARLVGQLLVESALLAVLGAAAGIFVAAAAARLLSRLIAPYIPALKPVVVDSRMILFGLASAAGTVLLFGLLPAIRAARTEASTLRGEMAGSARGLDRLRGALVSFETGLSLVLLTAAILLVQTLAALQRQDSGIATDHLLTFKVSPSGNSSGQSLETSFYAPLRRRLAAIPGVRAVGMINRLPLEDWGVSGTFLLEGRPAPADLNQWYAELRVVSAGYLAAVGASSSRGTDFTGNETPQSPAVAIVNEEFTRRYFGRESPLGRRFRLEATSPPVTIVGEYRSIRQRGLGHDADAEIDFPSTQIVPSDGLYEFGLAATETFVVRSAVAPESLAPTIRRAVREVDSRQPVFGFRTMDEIRNASMGGDRFALSLIATFAAIALLLCLVGIHGVMSYFVAQRTRDIGVRMALGATRGDILRLVLRSALLIAVVGIGLGLAGSVMAGGVLRSILFGVHPSDPATLAGAALALLMAATAAAYLPALRAANVSPMAALRNE